MKVLITGGSGFIGTNLSNELNYRGIKNIITDIKQSSKDNFVRADAGNYRQLSEVFSKFGPFNFVFHLAAEYGRWNGEDFYEDLWQTNAIGTKNILRLQEKNKFKLIFFSSAEVYGDFEGKMKEDVMVNNPIKDTYQMNDYAITKWAGELMCHNSRRIFGTETVIVRPVNCYGPYEHFTEYRGFIPKFIFYALNKRKYVVYKKHRRIIDFVEDSCKTIANIIDNFIDGETYNIGGKEEWEMEIKSYSDLILKKLNISDEIVEYRDSELNTTKIKQIDFTKSIDHLNHNPLIDPEEGISKTVDWMKSYYNF